MRIRGDAGPGPFMSEDGATIRAKRLDVTPWRDPRLIAGIVLILASTVLGGWVVAAADHTESYWAVGSDVSTGDLVRRDDLVPFRAKVPSRTASDLLRTDRPLPERLANLRWATDARAGALVTEASFASRRSAVELPIAIGAGGLPGDLRRGDRVDVWSLPDDAGDRARAATTGTARRVLTGVRVVSRTSGTGITGGPGVTLVVDAAGKSIDGKLVSALSAGHITVVRVS